MAVSKNGSRFRRWGRSFGQAVNETPVSRRAVLEVIAGGAAALGLAGCGQGLVDVSNSAHVRPNQKPEEQDTIYKYEKSLTDDILNFGQATSSVEENRFVRLVNNAYGARETYAKKVWAGDKDKKERLGWVATRHNNLVAWSMVRDLPAVPESVHLEDLVRLHIAEKVIIGKAAHDVLEARRKAYEKAYETERGVEIKDKDYNGFGVADIKGKILEQYRLGSMYRIASKKKGPLEGIFGVAEFVVKHLSPLDELGYAFDHRDVPNSKRLKKAEENLYENLVTYFERGSTSEIGMIEFFRRKNALGRVHEVKEDGKTKYRIDVNDSGANGWILAYNNAISGADLREAQYFNKATGLYLGSKLSEYRKKTRTGGEWALDSTVPESKELHDEITKLREAKVKAQTALAYGEYELAQEELAKFGDTPNRDKNESDTYLTRAMARSLASYVLATDESDKAMFYNIWQDYHKKVSERGLMGNEEGRATIRDSYIRILHPYMGELKDLNDKAGTAFLIGTLQTVGITCSVVNLAAGGAAGGAAGAGGFSVTGGFI